MSVTLDVNVLLDAVNEDHPEHERVRGLLGRLAAGPGIVHLFLPVAAGFLRIATSHRVFPRSLDFATAMDDLTALADRPHVMVLGGDSDTLAHLADLGDHHRLAGNHVPDAHIVALMHTYGTREIWTSDRDLRRFEGITVRDPLSWGR